jgi:ribosome-binding protein aMBF1 (putative translation factor)
MKICSARNLVMFDCTGLSFLAHVAERHRREQEAQMISGPQIRAARGFLGWTARELARKAVVGINTVQKIESGEVAASLAELVAIQATLAAEGIEFTDEDGVPGVRLHKKKRQK